MGDIIDSAICAAVVGAYVSGANKIREVALLIDYLKVIVYGQFK